VCAGCDRRCRTGRAADQADRSRRRDAGGPLRAGLRARMAGIITEMKYRGNRAGRLPRPLLWEATGGECRAGRCVRAGADTPVAASRARLQPGESWQAPRGLAARLAPAARCARPATPPAAGLARDARLTNVAGSIRSAMRADWRDGVSYWSTMWSRRGDLRECALALAGHGIGDVSAWAVASSADRGRGRCVMCAAGRPRVRRPSLPTPGSIPILRSCAAEGGPGFS